MTHEEAQNRRSGDGTEMVELGTPATKNGGGGLRRRSEERSVGSMYGERERETVCVLDILGNF